MQCKCSKTYNHLNAYNVNITAKGNTLELLLNTARSITFEWLPKENLKETNIMTNLDLLNQMNIMTVQITNLVPTAYNAMHNMATSDP